MQELATLHDRHLNRPTLDDSVDEEQTIEITTKEITQVHFIRRGGRHVGLMVGAPGREVQIQDLAGSLCCVFRQNSLLSQCFSPLRV